MDVMKESLKLHRKLKGKIEIKNKYDIQDKKDLALVYTPGVASSCLAIKDDPKESYHLTAKANSVAVISDGTAVLGLGDIGALAAMPVMEGKCAIFKAFADINATPIVLNTKDVDEIVKTIYHLAPSFGGINLEDISAPRCFEIEKRLRDMLDIPVFHDDQHGTAIAVGAALINALKLMKLSLSKAKIIINGAGSAGVAISRFLIELGADNLIICDKAGILNLKDNELNHAQIELAKETNKENIVGSLSDALKGAQVFIGVSKGNLLDKDMIKMMDKNPIIFALANPTPEISREDALDAGAKIYGSGVSNIPNQINNALVFPGVFKGALASPVKQIDRQMEIAACHALAHLVSDKDLAVDYIIPDVFNKDVVTAIQKAIIDVKLTQ
jgi:malate dehydrogenase (oxaloacetate-decarboxylating)